MIEGGQGYEIDGKICHSVPYNALRINEEEVYVAFMDRFYTVPETAIIVLAMCRSGASAFRIRGFVNGAILELNSDPAKMMAKLLTFAQRQIRHAFSTGTNLPEFLIEQDLSIPEGYADLGDRQPTTGNRPAAINPNEPRKSHFTRVDGLRWARLKASRDARVPQGLEDQAIPKYGHINDYVIPDPEHSEFFLAGWAELSGSTE